MLRATVCLPLSLRLTFSTKSSDVFVDERAMTPPGVLRNMTSTDRNSPQQLTHSYPSCECEYMPVCFLMDDRICLCFIHMCG